MYNIDNLKTFPENTGVYIMQGIDKNILYIGKALNLKNRVYQYFNGQDKREKVKQLIKKIEHINYIVTNTELEALILENNLIKENKPPFNTLLKDDKGYPYIKITKDEYPRLAITKKIEKDKSLYYGPFIDTKTANGIINTLQKHFKLVMCEKMKKKACLYFQINKCLAPCIKNITKDEYLERVEKCKDILKGDINDFVKQLTIKMDDEAANLNFEKANIIKSEIEYIKQLKEKQYVQLNNKNKSDIIVNRKNIIVLFRIQDGKLIHKQQFNMTQTDNTIENFITQCYGTLYTIPEKIILEKDIENKELLEQFLENIQHKKCKITTIQKGKNKKLLDLAIKNAEVIINEKERHEKLNYERDTKGLNNLEKILNIKLNRIEAYDISNLSGTLNVASMIVFENGKKNRKLYRKFKLKYEGMNDYECMKEVIKRRFTDEKLLEHMPDILMIDGGKGQINAVKEILDELKINIKLCGLVKDDKHNTRGLYFENEEKNIDKNSPEFKLLTLIQDETHNFAINYNRKLRNNTLKIKEKNNG